MPTRFRRLFWLTLAVTAIMALATGAVAAHEGRPVGDYRFIVGWLEEPTYEGGRNAISVRVNRVVEGNDHDDSDGHHGEQTGSVPATESDTSAGHHQTDDTPTEEHDTSTDHHGEGEEEESMESAAHEGGHHGPVEAASAMSVDIEAAIDPFSGVNVHVDPSGFTFAPESVNLDNVDGEGHAHIYVDGVKLSRVYTPWFHLDGLQPGTYEVEVRLNTNDHSEYVWNGEVVKASTQVEIPEPRDSVGHHDNATTAADSEMSVSIRLEPDPLGGANLFITGTTGFTFTPDHAGDHHHAGEGHAHVYVNGVKVSRIYGNAFQLGRMAEGLNEVRVTLNANDQSEYTWNGEPVQAIATISIAEGMGGAGYESPDEGHHSSLAPRGGAGKPLASIAGQSESQGVVPVEGLEDSLRVEVKHVASGETRSLDLEAIAGDPGHYVAGLIPTAPGVYEFRVFGNIEGLAIDETFASYGGGGGFDDVQTSAELQFPVVLPEVREIQSGVRGAMQTAQQAQDAALAAQEDRGGNALVIVALIVGIVGAVLGAGGLLLGLRGRRS